MLTIDLNVLTENKDYCFFNDLVKEKCFWISLPGHLLPCYIGNDLIVVPETEDEYESDQFPVPNGYILVSNLIEHKMLPESYTRIAKANVIALLAFIKGTNITLHGIKSIYCFYYRVPSNGIEYPLIMMGPKVSKVFGVVSNRL